VEKKRVEILLFIEKRNIEKKRLSPNI
jgi:hypothetical protein